LIEGKILRVGKRFGHAKLQCSWHEFWLLARLDEIFSDH